MQSSRMHAMPLVRRIKCLLTFIIVACLLVLLLLLRRGALPPVNYHAVPRYIQGSLQRLVSTSYIPVSALLTEDRSRFYGQRSSGSSKPLPFLSGFPRYSCGCGDSDNVKIAESLISPNNQSTCSLEANAHVNQKVISYSIALDPNQEQSFFLEGIVPTVEGMRSLFPDWSIRVYTNIPINNHSCDLVCKYPYLFWCDIGNIPNLGNMSRLNGHLWRVLPLGDPTVDLFLSRDMVSNGTVRERIAVSEWETSDKAIHVIRDSQWHQSPILAELFGFKNTGFTSEELRDLQGRIIRMLDKSWDQLVVHRLIYRAFHHKVLAHDSYFCYTFPDGAILPFSKQRFGQEFVGYDSTRESRYLYTAKLAPCPKKCRPEHGKNWTYC